MAGGGGVGSGLGEICRGCLQINMSPHFFPPRFEREKRTMPSLVSRAGALCAAVLGVSALDDGLARTPPMTTNSWTSFGSGVSAADLLTTGQLLVSTGLRDAGFTTVGSDDGWSLGTRDASGKLQADPGKFPAGVPGIVNDLKALNLSFGIYGAESSVTCTGRSGSLFYEAIDAQTYVDWGVFLGKIDKFVL
jgi:alpha-galactosidase